MAGLRIAAGQILSTDARVFIRPDMHPCVVDGSCCWLRCWFRRWVVREARGMMRETWRVLPYSWAREEQYTDRRARSRWNDCGNVLHQLSKS
jgi:hypothetical protein